MKWFTIFCLLSSLNLRAWYIYICCKESWTRNVSFSTSCAENCRHLLWEIEWWTWLPLQDDTIITVKLVTRCMSSRVLSLRSSKNTHLLSNSSVWRVERCWISCRHGDKACQQSLIFFQNWPFKNTFNWVFVAHQLLSLLPHSVLTKCTFCFLQLCQILPRYIAS